MKKTSLLCIIVACAGWGTSGIFVHYLSPYGFTSIHMTFIRSLAMFGCMALYALISDRTLFKISFRHLLLTVGSGLAFFSTASCYFYSMTESSVSTAVVLMYTAPIFVMIYSVLFLGEKLTKIKTLCVILMLIGCGLVSGIIGGFSFDAVGIIFGFMAGLSYSAYNILTKIQMKKGMNPITANLYGFFFSMLAGAICANVGHIPAMISQNTDVVLPLVILLGIVTSVMPYLTYSVALKYLPAGTASSLAILEPMMATVLSIIFLGEKPKMVSSVGIVLILFSVFILSREKDETSD